MFAALAGAGCMEERDPINRVQANALPKTFFVGEQIADPADDPEFYWRNYVVDASASQSLIGVGSWGHVDRVRWEVTEDLLIARKAYQIADGQDNKGVQQSDPLDRAKIDKGFTKTPNSAQLPLLLAVRLARAVGRHRELERGPAHRRDHRRRGADHGPLGDDGRSAAA